MIGLIAENVIQGSQRNSDGECTPCLSPLDCARSAYGRPSVVREALNEDGDCDVCAGNVAISEDCTIYTEDTSGDGASDDEPTDGDESDEQSSGADSNDDEDHDSGGDDGSEDSSGDDPSGDGNDEITPEIEPNDASQNGGGSNEDYDIDNDYPEDRDPTKDYGDTSPVELAEKRQQEGATPVTCETPDENMTTMERWMRTERAGSNGRSDGSCETDEDAADGTMTAMQRWFVRDDTPELTDLTER